MELFGTDTQVQWTQIQKFVLKFFQSNLQCAITAHCVGTHWSDSLRWEGFAFLTGRTHLYVWIGPKINSYR